MHVLVTGGAGFIGANLCRALELAGHTVTAFDDLSTGFSGNLDGTDAELVVGTILDTAALEAAIAPADAVVHLAARPSVPRSIVDPVASHLVNATGTVNVLEAARRDGSRHVISAGSSSVYGANPELPKHEGLATRPVSPYAASKLAAEAYTLAYGHSYGLPTLAFRFFNVFGPLQAAGHAYAAVIPAFADAALRGEPIPVDGDGTQSRDFTFVDTLTAVVVDAVNRQVTSDLPVNLAYGTRTDLLTVISMIDDLVDGDVTVEHGPARPGDVPHSQADDRRIRALFPDIEPVPLAIGLKATVDWMRAVI
ncbi:MAG: NAD-dependent epimerase/dehydratase family protein [Actinobacteria bacterium]|nr:NAD-dependent epimerase/dehydratase family protein [Actinomycetota bacterium]NIS36328.1 NAD-dependent epimerase/dehydratase family protein [Actinomycetota bacterium]NIT98669.1 NAD-dependent epimerase/dehydratase family protein [Actinomycetota bacterium]NIU22284.1 NAD-dependent epimerase/dehydratase family protein [Actinomycetota bacterium]NIU70868.1 NAD-dependent epimerase/dehydratase family protein [Actinomycetota bacterium]